MKIMGSRWRSLTVEEKQPWQQAAEADKVRYKREVHNYPGEVPSKKGSAHKKKRVDDGKPKKALSPYIFFSKEWRSKLKDENPEMKVQFIMQTW
jgi:high mobility group protein B3